MFRYRLFATLFFLPAILTLTSCGSGSHHPAAESSPGQQGFDLILIPGDAQGIGYTAAPFEAIKYDKASGSLQSLPVPPLASTREVLVTSSGQHIYSAAVNVTDYFHARVLMRTLSADGAPSPVEQELVLEGGVQDLAIDASAQWLVLLRSGTCRNDVCYWIESYPIAADGTLGSAVRVWDLPMPSLLPGASSVQNIVQIFNRKSRNEDVWIWSHTFQMDPEDSIVNEDGILYKVTIDDLSGGLATLVSRDFGQEYFPTFAQGRGFGFMAGSYTRGVTTLSSTTLEQVSKCTYDSQPTCDVPTDIAIRGDRERLFTLGLLGSVASLNVDSSGGVQQVATYELKSLRIPGAVASDSDGTHIFVGSSGYFPDVPRTITALAVRADGFMVEGASIETHNAANLQVLSH